MSAPEILVAHPRAGMAVLALKGEHDEYTSPRLSNELAALLAEALDVVVDLRDTTFLDSRTVGALLEAREEAASRDCRFVLWIDDTTGPAVRKLIEVTRLDTIIPVVASLEAALERRAGPDRRTNPPAAHSSERRSGDDRRADASSVPDI